VLIVYGEIQDKISEVPYTDVDYRVVTDGSWHIFNGRSPFNRHTYRYTPLLAIMLIPNIYLHRCFGKIVFALFDLSIAIIIKRIITEEYYTLISNQFSSIEDVKTKLEKIFSATSGSGGKKRIFNARKEAKNFGSPDKIKFEKMANFAAYVWLYNPLTMVIATRGNGDAITSSLVLFSIYYMLKIHDNASAKENEKNVIKSGIFHGLAIHFRLYPIFFSLAYYMYLSDNKFHINSLQSIVNCFLKPNRKQIYLVITVLKVLIFLTGIFYLLYDYQFLYESIFYHFIRKDTRHNFSLYFYLQYLNSGARVNILEKFLTFTPQLVLIILISFHFSRTRQTFQFGLFLIAFIMVAYNPVVTSQYFVWFLSLLPLTVNNFRNLSFKQIIILPALWFIGQGMWLLCAYFLEFKGINSFDFIWLASAIFFIINVIILQILIENYDDGHLKLK
jgi:phosphatidylinositol glycan class M